MSRAVRTRPSMICVPGRPRCTWDSPVPGMSSEHADGELTNKRHDHAVKIHLPAVHTTAEQHDRCLLGDAASREDVDGYRRAGIAVGQRQDAPLECGPKVRRGQLVLLKLLAQRGAFRFIGESREMRPPNAGAARACSLASSYRAASRDHSYTQPPGASAHISVVAERTARASSSGIPCVSICENRLVKEGLRLKRPLIWHLLAPSI